MVRGTGVDIIEIRRIEKAMARSERLAARIFTPGELQSCPTGKGRFASLAARFAAKEAVSKALGTGIGAIRWTDIEIIKNNQGKPEVKLYARADAMARELGIHSMAVSLSHAGEYAIAFVVAY